ncbi:hypothetical protein AB0N09_41465 [Streptomyces erythrochromogenes]|uniref:hypothetical protein n=1 Tax=Streptomyces erythrochromogenes TaxID=285574 RepID=UPI0034323D73
MNSQNEQLVVVPAPQTRGLSAPARIGIMLACGGLALLGSVAVATAQEDGKVADERNSGGVTTLAQGWKGRY